MPAARPERTFPAAGLRQRQTETEADGGRSVQKAAAHKGTRRPSCRHPAMSRVPCLGTQTQVPPSPMADQQETACDSGKGGSERGSPCFQQSLDGSIPERSIRLCHRGGDVRAANPHGPAQPWGKGQQRWSSGDTPGPHPTFRVSRRTCWRTCERQERGGDKGEGWGMRDQEDGASSRAPGEFSQLTQRKQRGLGGCSSRGREGYPHCEGQG